MHSLKTLGSNENQILNDQSDRHCTLSGTALGIGWAETYLWGQSLCAVTAASEDDEVSAPSTWPRPWNLAKRLMTENLSRSWQSNLKSKIEARLSNLKVVATCQNSIKDEFNGKSNWQNSRTKCYIPTPTPTPKKKNRKKEKPGREELASNSTGGWHWGSQSLIDIISLTIS